MLHPSIQEQTKQKKKNCWLLNEESHEVLDFRGKNWFSGMKPKSSITYLVL